MQHHFVLLTNPDKELVRESAIPDSVNRHLLPGASSICYSSHWGDILLQEWSVNGFHYGSHIFIIRSPAQIRFGCTAEKSMISYCLNGKLNIYRGDLLHLFSLDSHQYQLCLYPSQSEILLKLEPGEHHYFQIWFSVFLSSALSSGAGNSTSLFIPELSSEVITCHPYTLSFGKKVSALLNTILHSTNRLHADILHLNNYALQLIEIFIYDTQVKYQQAKWENRKRIKLEELETYILDHLDTDSKKYISLAACAKMTGTNTFHLKQLFFQRHHLSLAAFIRNKRMEKAMQLITISGLPASEIYLQVGFEDSSSFSRAFHQFYGHPPRFYKPR